MIKKSRNPYIIVPCTLDPENELSFSVTFSADAPITAQLISKEQEWPQPTILVSSALFMYSRSEG